MNHTTFNYLSKENSEFETTGYISGKDNEIQLAPTVGYGGIK